MNTNPEAIKILCFGDSNTWGQKPDRLNRYPVNIRWTGQLQDLLGDKYYVVEEGLGGRAVDLEHPNKPGRNGQIYLQPCLESQSPLDVVILMLGTNDLKIKYRRSVKEIVNSLAGLIDLTRHYSRDKYGNPPKIVLVSPILINSKAPRFTEFYTDYYDEEAEEKSKMLAGEIKSLAGKTNCLFVDAATVAEAGEDGIHFDEESEGQLAHLLANILQQINIKVT